MIDMPERYTEQREPFGQWLLTRPERRDWTDELAKMAKADRAFPKNGDVEAVRQHLAKQGADGDTFARLDDAETDYLSY